ncbi:MAG: 3'-5' exonuclease [Verrucomicrobia bacterium]|nr:3'-5' exonuclease [Verrucomicrobiota bacterium]
MLRQLLERIFPSHAPSARLDDTSFVVLDAEMTGLDARRDSIISLGAVKLEAGRILLGESFERLVDPGRALAPDNILVHRLTAERLAGQGGLAEAIEAFWEFCGEAILVGHCLRLDLGFLARCRPPGLPASRMRGLCTASTARWLEQQSVRFLGAAPKGESTGGSLAALARQLGLVFEQPQHDALQDAYVTAQVWQRLLRQLADHGVQRVSDLPRAAWVQAQEMS